MRKVKKLAHAVYLYVLNFMVAEAGAASVVLATCPDVAAAVAISALHRSGAEVVAR